MKRMNSVIIVFLVLVFSALWACGEGDSDTMDGDNDGDMEIPESEAEFSEADGNIEGDIETDGDEEIATELPDPSEWGPHGVGVRVFDFIDEDRDSRALPTVFVYPAAVDPVIEGQTVDGSGETTGLIAAGKISLYAVEDAAVDMSGAPYPVVYFSHGSGAGKSMQKYLLEYLASHGYICVAVDHTGNVGMQHFIPEFPDMTVLRLQDILFTMDKSAEVFADSQDILIGAGNASNAAVAGHSYGGHIALALAGAQYDYANIRKLCEESESPPDAYICPLLEVEAELAELLPDPRIKAAASLAHDASRYYFGDDYNGLRELATPTFFLSASEDSFGPPEAEAEPCFAETPSPAYLLELIGGGHIGFTDMENDAEMDTTRMHKLVQRYMAAFMGLHLKGQEGYRHYLEGNPAEVWSENMDDIVWEYK